MCGRFVIDIPEKILRETFGLQEVPKLEPRFNVTPGQLAAVVRNQGDRNRIDLLKWGLVPAWAKDPNCGSHLINAGSDTAFERPAFRHAIKYRRCVVPTSGFYEWERSGEHRKQPWFIRMADHSPMYLAGLWESWQAPSGNELETFAIMTTSANKLVAAIHDCMPVILTPDAFTLWLSHNMHDPEQLQQFYEPFTAAGMTAYRVAELVNTPHIDSAACCEPV